jgi:hypothetical protein
MPDITLRVSIHDGEYRYRCGWTSNGLDWEPVGCAHGRPAEAVEHSKRLVERRRSREQAVASGAAEPAL